VSPQPRRRPSSRAGLPPDTVHSSSQTRQSLKRRSTADTSNAPQLAGVVVALEPHVADVGVIHALLHPSPPERRARSSSAYWSARSSAAAAAWRTVVMEGDLGRDDDGTGVKVVTDAAQLEAYHRRRDGAHDAICAELIARLRRHRVRTVRSRSLTRSLHSDTPWRQFFAHRTILPQPAPAFGHW